MEENFYILYIVLYAIVFGVIYFLLVYVKNEKSLYQLFSKNNDMRALMANDPKRFHISIVYLMTYMTRSKGNKVETDKLELIVRYIREVIPSEYHNDAINVLKELTERSKKRGKHTYYESVVDVNSFLTGNKCISDGDDSYHFIYDLHGRRLAEELAKYMSDNDRLYVMYLLYRLAIADGVITTEGKNSELYMLNHLCVKGLKIDKKELDSLIDHFKNRNDQIWYDTHFSNKENFYPTSDALADIFHMDMTSINLLSKEVSTISKLNVIRGILITTFVALFILGFVFGCYEDNLMGNLYPKWLFIGVFVAFVILMIISISIPRLESSEIPILRTKLEDSLQFRGLITSSILTLVVSITLFLGVSNTLFVVGNQLFSYHKTIEIRKTVTDTYTTTTRSKNRTTTHYHVRFDPVCFNGKMIDLDDNKKEVSYINYICLKTLPYFSCVNFKGIENTRSMSSLEVSHSEYYDAYSKDIVLTYKVGYFGLLYFDKYQIISRKSIE